MNFLNLRKYENKKRQLYQLWCPWAAKRWNLLGSVYENNIQALQLVIVLNWRKEPIIPFQSDPTWCKRACNTSSRMKTRTTWLSYSAWKNSLLDLHKQARKDRYNTNWNSLTVFERGSQASQPLVKNSK
jgi:hypothetical protein